MGAGSGRGKGRGNCCELCVFLCSCSACLPARLLAPSSAVGVAVVLARTAPVLVTYVSIAGPLAAAAATTPGHTAPVRAALISTASCSTAHSTLAGTSAAHTAGRTAPRTAAASVAPTQILTAETTSGLTRPAHTAARLLLLHVQLLAVGGVLREVQWLQR